MKKIHKFGALLLTGLMLIAALITSMGGWVLVLSTLAD